MRDPKLVAMTGPLSEYRDGFAGKLAGVGYATGSAEHQVGLMAHLSAPEPLDGGPGAAAG